MNLVIRGTVSSDDNNEDSIKDNDVGMRLLGVTLLLGKRTKEQELECFFQVVIEVLLPEDMFWVWR